jgi:hypothetical protein
VPKDVLIHVLSFLEPPQLLLVAQVSRKMNEAASSDRLWRCFENDLSRWFALGCVAWMRDAPDSSSGWKKKKKKKKKKNKRQDAVVKEQCRAQVFPRFEFAPRAPGDLPLKITLIGDGGTGKTCVVVRHTERVYPVVRKLVRVVPFLLAYGCK